MKVKERPICAYRNGVLVTIDDVEESGLACNCICPKCNEPLMARKGNHNVHHFAHKPNSNCNYGYQSSIHYLAKEIIASAQSIYIPELEIRGIRRESIHDDGIIRIAGRELDIKTIKLEHKIDSIIPDIVVYNNNDKPLAIEIFVTHAVDEEKERKIKDINIPVIEVDLSKVNHLITREELQNILLKPNDRKYWIFSPKRQHFLKTAAQLAQYKKLEQYNPDFCPLEKCSIINWPYYCFYNNCLKCKFRFQGTWCLAEANIENPEDIIEYSKTHLINEKKVDERLLKVLEARNYGYEKERRYWKRKGLL